MARTITTIPKLAQAKFNTSIAAKRTKVTAIEAAETVEKLLDL